MITRYGYPMLVVLVAAACAGGTTMRVVDDNDDQEAGSVALAPAPDPEPDSALIESPDSAIAETPGSPASVADSTSEPSQGYAPYGDSSAFPIRRIGQWSRTGINEARRLVIRDANAWAEFWAELGLGDRPGVDFSRDLVIAVAAGQRPSGGHEIAVKQITHTNGELIIEVVETRPGPNCIATTSLTQPVDVVVIPHVTPQSWSFVERQEVRACQ
ncbi:MAG TPA: protease complex subunit PrcB family protein [Gemmatimonadales bacterium]|nr:protease complex subunit PrcB family protein [Gemmatimonadales bacterium]